MLLAQPRLLRQRSQLEVLGSVYERYFRRSFTSKGNASFASVKSPVKFLFPSAVPHRNHRHLWISETHCATSTVPWTTRQYFRRTVIDVDTPQMNVSQRFEPNSLPSDTHIACRVACVPRGWTISVQPLHGHALQRLRFLGRCLRWASPFYCETMETAVVTYM